MSWAADFLSGKLEYELDSTLRQIDRLELNYKTGKISKEEAKAELVTLKRRAFA